MKTFFRLLFIAYRSPRRFADGLLHAPAPFYGLAAVLLRGALVSLLEYLPLHLMGRIPPMPSYLTFIPTERYYAALLWIGPLMFVAHWLFFSSLAHVGLRLLRQRSDMDILVNLSGMISLVIGVVLIAYDWVWIIGGWGNQWVMGFSHLAIDVWGIAISVVCLKRLLGVPAWLGIALNIIAILTWLPFGIIFMRSPV